MGGTPAAPLSCVNWVPVLRQLGAVAAVRAGRPGTRFHCKETEGEVSDDSDDAVQCPSASAWKYGPVNSSHA